MFFILFSFYVVVSLLSRYLAVFLIFNSILWNDVTMRSVNRQGFFIKSNFSQVYKICESFFISLLFGYVSCEYNLV